MNHNCRCRTAFSSSMPSADGEQGTMKTIIVGIAGALALASCSEPGAGNAGANSGGAQAQRPSDAESDAYMRKAEEDWAALAIKPIPGLLERILADDYVGVSSDT